MIVSRNTAKIAGQIAAVVTVARLRGLDVEQAKAIFDAIELMANDAIARYPSTQENLTSLIQLMHDSMQPKVTLQ